MADGSGAERSPDPGNAVTRRRRSGLPDRPIETWTHDELEQLVTGFPPKAPPAVHAANTVIGAADEIGRIVTGFLLGAAILVVLAVLITPWLWIAVAVWVGYGVATILWMISRRRRRDRPKPLAAPRP